jgi:general secretion pathway protein N
MLRLRIPLGRALFFATAFLCCALALLPLRFALDLFGFQQSGITARAVDGAIWQGVLREARFGRIAAGDLSARLRLLPLLLGQSRIDFETLSRSTPLRGSLSVSREGFGVHDLTGTLPLAGTLPGLALGALEANDFSVAFANGACGSATGLVSATIRASAAMPFAGRMAGTARCDRGALLLPLAGQSGVERLNLRVYPDGAYRAELIIRGGDATLAQPFAAAGFTQSEEGYVRRFDGRF